MAKTDPSETISIERLVEARGVALKRRGGRLLGLCPFHETEAPELVVTPRTNTWRCPACAPEAAGVVEWMMRAEGVSRGHASAMLRAGVVETREAKKRGRQKGAVPERSTVPLLPMLFDGDESDAELLEKIAGFYAEALVHAESAQAFLKARHISERALKAFRIGYADRTLGLRIPKPNRVLGAHLRKRLGELGVMRKESGHEHLRGCVVVPYLDLEGRVAGMVGRRVERQESDRGEELSVSGGLFNARGIEGAKEIVIAGSMLEALIAWSSGIEHVTALPEAADVLIDALSAWGTKRVTLLLRRTKEPSAKERELVSALASKRIEVLRAVLPLEKDVEDLIRSEADGAYKLGQLVRTAEWIGGVARPVASPNASPATSVAPRRPEPTAKASEDGLVFVLGDRRWRVRGLGENHARGVLKVNVFVSREGVGFHVDTFDLYSSRQRTAFWKQASLELGIEETAVKKDLGQVLLELERAQDELLAELARPAAKTPEMTDEEKRAARALLADPSVLERVLEDLEELGVVGEKTNLTLFYLATLSRKLAEPLCLLMQSSKEAAPASMLGAVLALVPDEDRLSFSALTGQSLYYMAPGGLRHKVLAVTEESGERAAHSLRLLVRQGALTIASTAKETSTGRLVSHEYSVEGPVAIVMSTTTMGMDEELVARSVVCAVDESAEQTRRIQEAARARTTLEGLVAREKSEGLVKLHQNAQRLLRSVRVVNPFASSMIYPDHRVRARLDQKKLLGLIETLALLHQHQRPLRQVEEGGKILEYIEATKEDVELAERLLSEVGTIGARELPPQTAKLFDLVEAFVREKSAESSERRERASMHSERFSRRELREHIGWGDTQLWTHLKRLVALELVVEHRAGVGRGVVYELVGGLGSVRESSGSIRASFGADSESIRERENGSEAVNRSASEEAATPAARPHRGPRSSKPRVGIPRAS